MLTEIKSLDKPSYGYISADVNSVSEAVKYWVMDSFYKDFSKDEELQELYQEANLIEEARYE